MELILKSLYLNQFKNHLDSRFEFTQGINCITGPNGSGKTNILEAIYYLSYCKGYFNSLDSQNIYHGLDQFSIRGEFQKEESNWVSCSVQKGQRKRFKKDDKEYDRLMDHIGAFPCVIISPYDVDLIREGSEARRRFMDMIISSEDKIYMSTLVDYNKALSQRNNLLKYFWENRTMDSDQLAVWNEQLHALGHSIFERRKQFFADFRPIFREFQLEISGGKDEADLEYVSHLHEEPLIDLLEAGLDQDMRRHHTLKGVHKDDLQMTIGGHPVKRFGSQGQQKTFLISLKLAQFQFITEHIGIRPVLLLDDIFDKIDDQRVAYIVGLVSEDRFGQIFITDTSAQRMDSILGELSIGMNRIVLDPNKITIEAEKQ